MLHGTVGSVAHFGDVLQYVIRTPLRDVLVLTPRAAAIRMAPGEPAWCRWSAEDVYVFSAQQADVVLASELDEETAP